MCAGRLGKKDWIADSGQQQQRFGFRIPKHLSLITPTQLITPSVAPAVAVVRNPQSPLQSAIPRTPQSVLPHQRSFLALSYQSENRLFQFLELERLR